MLCEFHCDERDRRRNCYSYADGLTGVLHSSLDIIHHRNCPHQSITKQGGLVNSALSHRGTEACATEGPAQKSVQQKHGRTLLHETLPLVQAVDMNQDEIGALTGPTVPINSVLSSA